MKNKKNHLWSLALVFFLLLPLSPAIPVAWAEEFIPVEGFSLEYSHWVSEGEDGEIFAIIAGDIGQISPYVWPYDATIREFSFESSNTDVVTVSSGGMVRALSAGTAVITIRSMDPSFTEARTIDVKVFAIEQCEMSLSTDVLNLETGDWRQLAAMVTEPNAGSSLVVLNVAWSTSDDQVATVDDDGLVRAISPGNTTITATMTNGLSESCAVTVSPKPPPKPLQPKVALVSGAVESGTLTDGILRSGSIVALLCDTEDAAIKYSIDNSPANPEDSPYIYPPGTTINVNSSMTIKAVSYKNGVCSNVLVCSYGSPQLTPPTASPSPTGYVNGVRQGDESGTKVELLQTGFTGGEIRYTFDGSEPEATSTLYTGPITLNESTTQYYMTSQDLYTRIKAKVFKDGYTASNTATFSYFVTVAKPVITALTGTITCPTPGAEIHYVTSTNDLTSYWPTTSDPLYTGPISRDGYNTTYIKARAFKSGLNPSGAVGDWFSGKMPTPVAYSWSNPQPITQTEMTVTPGYKIKLSSNYLQATIRYTTNGTDPTASSTAFVSGTPIEINSATTIKARAFLSGHPDSDILTLTFKMASPPPAPTASIASGSSVNYETEVQFYSSDPDVIGFLYTQNGATPTQNSYGSYDPNSRWLARGKTFKLIQDCTLKVIATKRVDDGSYVQGLVASFTYKVNPASCTVDMGSPLNYTLPSSTPLVENRRMNINLNNLPGNFWITNGIVKLAIGTNFASGKVAEERDADFTKLKNNISACNRTGVKSVITPFGISETLSGVNCIFEIAGYLEGTMNYYGEISLGGKLMLYAHVDGEWNAWYLIFEAGVGFSGTISFWGGTALTFTGSPKVVEPQAVLQYAIGLTAKAGIGIPYIASAGVYGSGSFNHRWDILHNYNKIWLYGEMGAYEKFLFWETKQKVLDGTWNVWNTFPSGSPSYSPALAAPGMPERYDLGNYELMPRNYLEKQSAWFGAMPRLRSATMFNVLQQSIYSETSPLIAEADGKRVMVFLADDGTRDDYNRTVLMYSVYNSVANTWSDPKAVNDNGTADFYPSIASDGTNLWVAWQRSKTTFNAASTIEDVFTAGEIAAAHFNTGTETFGTPTVLTANDFMDAMPKIAVNNGNVLVSWIQNPDNDVYGTNGSSNKIMERLLTTRWMRATEVKSGLGAILDLDAAYFDGKFQIAYVTDRDNDLTTIDDRDLITMNVLAGTVEQTPVTDKLVSGIHFSSIGGGKVLSWFEEGALRYMTEAGVSHDLTAGADMPTDNYKIFTNGTQTAAVYPASENQIGYLFARDYEAGQFGNPYKLVKTEGYAGYFDGVLENTGEFNIVFNNSMMEFVDGELVEENDLLSLKVAPPVNIRLADISYLQEEVKLGQPLNVSLDIANIGAVAVSDVVVKVNGATAGTYPAGLKTGEQTTLDFPLNVPSGMAPLTKFEISVEPAGLTDADMNDNSFTVTLGYTNFSLLLNTVYSDNDTVTVITNVTNNSDFAANAMLLVRRGAADGEVFDMVELGSLAGRQNEVTEWVYDIASLFPEGESYMPLYFEIVTDADAQFGTSEFVVIYNNNAMQLQGTELFSGYVYERVDGDQTPLAEVTATCWLADDENGTNARLWEEFMEYGGQINPQITAADGRYEWCIPDGWWQVRLSKTGYYDAQSEWLPIPPPQLEVNIEMKMITDGIDELESGHSIVIYPNPTQGKLRITAFGDNQLNIENIAIFDVYGRQAPLSLPEWGETSSPPVSVGMELDISHLPSGIYSLQIRTDKGLITKKVVKN